MLSDIEIAQSAKMLPITEIAEKLDILPEELELYGRYKAKLSEDIFARLQDKPDGKLVLVTAINPTPAGEGKTTTSVGLGQAMARIGEKAVIALREPSLGPVFGIKGGAAGGGYSQVIPMEDINLHFTGDFHAIGAANNLLAAMLDNHIQQGNALGIDVKKITWKRCVDMNDRQLRQVEEMRKLERHPLPADMNYAALQGLRLEARQKLEQIRPLNLGQASRISGVSPADVAALMIYLERG